MGMSSIDEGTGLHLLLCGGERLPVEDGFDQTVALVAEGQQEEGSILPQQVQEDLVALPFG